MDVFRTVAVVGCLAFSWVAPAWAGDVRGVVRLDGPVPAPKVLTVEPKKAGDSLDACGDHARVSQRLVVDPSGGVQHSVVWLQAASPDGQVAAKSAASNDVAVLDQQRCEFVPHVMVIPSSVPLVIRNSDPVRHNVRIFHDGMMLMHRWQQAKADEIEWRFEQGGRYLVRCGIHPWMHAWVVVADHRYYAVTNADGSFSIPEVPDGQYVLRVWHETLGEREETIRVGADGEDVTVRFAQGGGSE